jgi:hypothetical protein
METLLTILVLLCFSQLIIGPVLIYFAFRQQVHHTFAEFAPENPPTELPQNYFDAIKDVEKLGFRLIAHIFQDGQINKITTYVTLLRNEEEKTAVAIIYMLAPNVKANSFIEFCTTFADGTELNTNNTQELNVFTPPPEKQIFCVPHVEEVDKLYALHQKLLANQRKKSERILPPTGTEIKEVCDSMTRDFETQVDAGYLKRDQAQQAYRTTIKGAILMTWKLAWPIGTIRKKSFFARGKKLMRQFQLEE